MVSWHYFSAMLVYHIYMWWGIFLTIITQEMFTLNIWESAELPKCDSLKLAVIKVTWPRCRNIQTSSERQGRKVFTPFLVPYCCKLSSHCSATDSKWACTPPLVPDTRHKNVTSVLPKFCAPHTSTLKNDLSRNNPTWTHMWTSVLEKSSPFIWSVISWAAWDKTG